MLYSAMSGGPGGANHVVPPTPHQIVLSVQDENLYCVKQAAHSFQIAARQNPAHVVMEVNRPLGPQPEGSSIYVYKQSMAKNEQGVQQVYTPVTLKDCPRP